MMKLYVNHLGFTPEDPEKRAIIYSEEFIKDFAVVDFNEMGYNEISPNQQANQYAFKGKLQSYDSEDGHYYIADFSALRKTGIYLVTIDNRYNSVPFQIREDVYTRTMRKAFDYIHIQRCGTSVEGYHESCHLDDAIRRDNSEYLDTTGGWHDAGDLRKWMAHSMLLGIAICQLKIHVNPKWITFNQTEDDLLDELRWGNNYFLKMLDPSGRVYNDVAAGIDGDNSDNRWTDNQIKSGDERSINTEYHPEVQWEFIYLNALCSTLFKESDEIYAEKCLKAALKALSFIECNPEYKTKITTWTFSCAEVQFTAWSLLAYKAVYAATKDKKYLDSLGEALKALLALQEKEYTYHQKRVKGFFYCDAKKDRIFKDLRDSGILLIALNEVCLIDELSPDLKEACYQSILLYCNDYILPLAKTNPFNIIPYGLFTNDLTDEWYHPLEGELRYRLFAPTKTPFYLGLTSHLLSHAVGLQMSGILLKERSLIECAKNQMEWVMGRNPEQACLMTGEGVNNPYPHSRFLGLIPGGIMNGYIGLENDQPYLDTQYQMDWRTTEYWSPHNCFYLWYLSIL